MPINSSNNDHELLSIMVEWHLLYFNELKFPAAILDPPLGNKFSFET